MLKIKAQKFFHSQLTVESRRWTISLAYDGNLLSQLMKLKHFINKIISFHFPVRFFSVKNCEIWDNDKYEIK